MMRFFIKENEQSYLNLMTQSMRAGFALGLEIYLAGFNPRFLMTLGVLHYGGATATPKSREIFTGM